MQRKKIGTEGEIGEDDESGNNEINEEEAVKEEKKIKKEKETEDSSFTLQFDSSVHSSLQISHHSNIATETGTIQNPSRSPHTPTTSVSSSGKSGHVQAEFTIAALKAMSPASREVYADAVVTELGNMGLMDKLERGVKRS